MLVSSFILGWSMDIGLPSQSMSHGSSNNSNAAISCFHYKVKISSSKPFQNKHLVSLKRDITCQAIEIQRQC